MYDNSGAVQTIKHPAGNVNYPARSTCLWVLQGPPGTNIQVQVSYIKVDLKLLHNIYLMTKVDLYSI